MCCVVELMWVLARFGVYWGVYVCVFRAFSTILGLVVASWGHLGPSWGHLGSVLGRLGDVLERFSRHVILEAIFH